MRGAFAIGVTYVDEQANRVIVGLGRMTRHARAELRRRYGAKVRAELIEAIPAAAGS